MELMSWIDFHLPALVVVTPLIAGIMTVFAGKKSGPWLWSCLVHGIVFAMTLRLSQLVHGLATLPMEVGDNIPVVNPAHISYLLGSWPRQWGIELRVDALNSVILLIVAGIAFLTTIYSGKSVEKEIGSDRRNWFYAVWNLTIVGLLGITVTGDAFNVYVLLEISSLTIYALIAMGKSQDRRALTASLKYLILGSVGASFILLGIGYLLMITGTLNMADMGESLRALENPGENRTLQVAVAFLLVGLSMKMALFPLHMWLPNAYTYAPSAVSALLSATATKVGVYMAFRFLYTIIGPVFSFESISANELLMGCATLGILICSYNAMTQDNVKRILAYSSVAQIGYIVLGFALHTSLGVAGSIIHIINHALIKGGMFMALGAVVYRMGAARLTDLSGLGRLMPWTMGAFTAGGLSLIGFPLTAGFISKWYLAQACLQAGRWYLVVALLVGSIFAIVYVWRVVEIIYFGEPSAKAKTVREAPLSMLIPTLIMIGLSLYFGVTAEWTGGMAETAAQTLLTDFDGGAQP